MINTDIEGMVDRIDLLLSVRKMGRKEFCEKIGLSPNALTLWKNRGSIPNAYTILYIADFFNVPYRWLLTGEQDKNSTLEKRFSYLPGGIQKSLYELMESFERFYNSLDKKEIENIYNTQIEKK